MCFYVGAASPAIHKKGQHCCRANSLSQLSTITAPSKSALEGRYGDGKEWVGCGGRSCSKHKFDVFMCAPCGFETSTSILSYPLLSLIFSLFVSYTNTIGNRI